MERYLKNNKIRILKYSFLFLGFNVVICWNAILSTLDYFTIKVMIILFIIYKTYISKSCLIINLHLYFHLWILFLI